MFANYQSKKFESRNRTESPNGARQKILQDSFLKHVYLNILNLLLANRSDSSDGSKSILEIGSAGGITKLFHNYITTSDVRKAEGVDLILDASGKFPFEDGNIDLIIGKDVLHHINDVETHFTEVLRILKPGGKIVYAEPNWNFISRLILTFLHPEPYLPSQRDWKFPSNDPMFSNQALPFIIFVRDLKLFQNKFPDFELNLSLPPLNGLAFLMSGGVYRRTSIPSDVLIKISNLENKVRFWMKLMGLTRIIILEKK